MRTEDTIAARRARINALGWVQLSVSCGLHLKGKSTPAALGWEHLSDHVSRSLPRVRSALGMLNEAREHSLVEIRRRHTVLKNVRTRMHPPPPPCTRSAHLETHPPPQRVACIAASNDRPNHAMYEAELFATVSARKALSSASVAAEKGDLSQPFSPTPHLTHPSGPPPPRPSRHRLHLLSAPLLPLHPFHRHKNIPIFIFIVIIAMTIVVILISHSNSVCLFECKM